VKLNRKSEDGTHNLLRPWHLHRSCRGGHIPNTGIVKAIKILQCSRCLCEGNEKNNQLTRVYGIFLSKQKDLPEYLELLEEAKKRDHKKLGKNWKLFTFSPEVGQGFPFMLPKGGSFKGNRLENFWKKAQKKAGYEMLLPPHIGQRLYVTSGHLWKSMEPTLFNDQDHQKKDWRVLGKTHELVRITVNIYNSKPFSLQGDYQTICWIWHCFTVMKQKWEFTWTTRVVASHRMDAHFCTPDQIGGRR